MSVVLGIVEGLTEFLPVSSTAHLRIAEYLLNISLQSGYWKMYTIVVQIGAIATLPIYFREHIHRLFSTFPRDGCRAGGWRGGDVAGRLDEREVGSGGGSSRT